jgi:EAL domain-containing protein (putative c-di-GMP-specific phosphodiesterase class I)
VILDNFSTGATSLRGLREFRLDALKIERSLVREMQSDLAAGDMVELISTPARKINLKVIAEGIENARQVGRLRGVGCEYGQGYYFSPAEGSEGGGAVHAPADYCDADSRRAK